MQSPLFPQERHAQIQIQNLDSTDSPVKQKKVHVDQVAIERKAKVRTPSCDGMVVTPDILVTKSRCESFVILNSGHEEAVRQVRVNDAVLYDPINQEENKRY